MPSSGAGHFEEAFLALHDRYADAIFRHCYFRIADRERAKDLVQETFTRTWAYLADGQVIAHPQAFLYRTATNLIVDDVRRKRELSLEALEEEGFQPVGDTPERLTVRMEAAEVLAVMRELSDADREVLILRFVDGFAPREIAEIAGETPNVISVRIHRAKAKLRAALRAHRDAAGPRA